MNSLETSGSGTQQIIQRTGVKRVAPTAVQYWARDLASDYQYHGRQQEAPRIARTRPLYSAKASQRRDERPQDASSHHRCCGRRGGPNVKRYSHHARFRYQEKHQQDESSPRLGGSLRRPRRARSRLFKTSVLDASADLRKTCRYTASPPRGQPVLCWCVSSLYVTAVSSHAP